MNLFEGGNEFKLNSGSPATKQQASSKEANNALIGLGKEIGIPLEKYKAGSIIYPGAQTADADVVLDPVMFIKVKPGTEPKQAQNTFRAWLAQQLEKAGYMELQKNAPVPKPGKYYKIAADGWTVMAPVNKTEYLQIDLDIAEPNEGKFALWSKRGEPNADGVEHSARAKGAFRHILKAEIARTLVSPMHPQGLMWSFKNGLLDRASKQPVLNGKDPSAIAKILFNGTAADLENIPAILKKFRAAHPTKFNEVLEKANAGLEKAYGKVSKYRFSESALSARNEVDFLAKLRDRIVNQGMLVLVEAEEGAVSGGQAKGIEHLEDLVFRKGSKGIAEALAIIAHVKEETAGTVTVKWDGIPAIVWGRDVDGAFVLTDVSGFTAKGYDGLAKSPKQIEKIMAQRDASAAEKGNKANRVDELYPIYAKLWPLLKAATPDNFKGYVQGDLLYTTQPPLESGQYVFQPNTVKYHIPANSATGKKIAVSDVGIAMHTRYKEPGASKQPLGNVKFNPVRGLMLLAPIVPTENIRPNPQIVKGLKDLYKQQGKNIDQLFNPMELRTLQLTDFPRLCVDYINSLVKNPAVSSFNDLLPGFAEYLKTKVTGKKFNNIVEYLQSPRSNQDALAAAFTAFIMLHDLKLDVLKQLDLQHPGQEGWVMATPSGYAKAVNRFDFARTNALRHS